MYLYKNNFSVSENLLPGHANKHSKQLIYETNIINIFNDFKVFLILVSFNFNATCDDNLVIPECILALYTELIIVLVKLIVWSNFDHPNLWEIVALMVCFNSFNFSQLIYRIFIVFMFYLIWQKKLISSI